MRKTTIGKSSRRRGPAEGATAVEFALVATPLFFMIFAILEVAVVFIVSTALENAVARTARLIRTGEAQAAGYTKTRFETEACGRMMFLKDHCLAQRLHVDVRVVPQFRDGNGSSSTTADDFPNPVSSGGQFNPSGLCFNGGQQGDIVLVRAYYRWPLATAFMTKALSRLSSNEAVLQTAETFRNEPFGPAQNAPAESKCP